LTVTVPFVNPNDPTTGETQVSFWNTLNRTSFKICKAIDPHASAALGGLNYTFTATTTVNGVTQAYGPFTLTPPYPKCTGFIGNIPFANANGTPTTITVTEITSFPGAPVSIVVQGGSVVSSSTTTQTVTFNPNGNPAIVTFTNGQPSLLCFSGEQDTFFSMTDPAYAAEAGINPNDPQTFPGGHCEIRPDGASANINTTSEVCTQHQFTVTGCYAGVYALSEGVMGEPTATVQNLRFSYTGGPIGGGSPRFSIPLDLNGDGLRDTFNACAPNPPTAGCLQPLYAFAEASTCGPANNGTAGTVDVINTPLCTISLNSGQSYPNWAAFVAANPGSKIAGDHVTFVIADQPFKGVFFNVAFGP